MGKSTINCDFPLLCSFTIPEGIWEGWNNPDALIFGWTSQTTIIGNIGREATGWSVRKDALSASTSGCFHCHAPLCWNIMLQEDWDNDQQTWRWGYGSKSAFAASVMCRSFIFAGSIPTFCWFISSNLLLDVAGWWFGNVWNIFYFPIQLGME